MNRYIIELNYHDIPDMIGEIVDAHHDKEMAIIEARIFYKKYRHKNICVDVIDTWSKNGEVIWSSDDHIKEIEYGIY